MDSTLTVSKVEAAILGLLVIILLQTSWAQLRSIRRVAKPKENPKENLKWNLKGKPKGKSKKSLRALRGSHLRGPVGDVDNFGSFDPTQLEPDYLMEHMKRYPGMLDEITAVEQIFRPRIVWRDIRSIEAVSESEFEEESQENSDVIDADNGAAPNGLHVAVPE
ncbi:hypothetical protein F5Y09DRAFT_338558 [Xylaria sp. FL1042]|nr:hypothetical protein F5Y09DRAFT_338558 [Xylaria sp. FL1042]